MSQTYVKREVIGYFLPGHENYKEILMMLCWYENLFICKMITIIEFFLTIIHDRRIPLNDY